MRWLALAVVTAALAVSLVACDFEGAVDAYCAHPGRCAQIDRRDAGTLQLSQGTLSRVLVVHGVYLQGAAPRIVPAGAADVTVVDGGTTEVVLEVSVPHGAPLGNARLELAFDRPGDLKPWDNFIQVTPIVVSQAGGDNTAGDGTFDRPFLTLRRASQRSGPGDLIQLGAGTYQTIFPDFLTPCDDAESGLRPGVTVRGESRASTFISGGGNQNTCAFNLYAEGQAVEDLTISGFPEGIRANGPDSGTRPRVSNVLIEASDQGVVARRGAQLLLQDVEISSPVEIGLVIDGADVHFRGGKVHGSGGPGIWLSGLGGTLVLDGVTVTSSAGGETGSTDPILGAGLSVASDAGVVFVDGGTFGANSATGITVSGSGNTVIIDGPDIRSEWPGGIGLHLLAGSNASVYLANTDFLPSDWAIKVEDFATFNGGLGDGTWGGNTLNQPDAGGAIWDARAGGAGHPPMTFARTQVRGRSVDAGRVFAGPVDDQVLGIKIDNSGNEVRFE